VTELARASVEQFNQGDFAAMRALMGPGFVYEETGTGRRITDPDDVITALRGWKEALPDVQGTIERLAVDGSTAAIEIVWRGTHSGTLSTPTGDLPATGRPIETRGTLWEEWQDGRLVAQRNHLDMLTLLAQVGAMGLAA
jgi:steroid delta-isomerase-like uncharacterized protein